MLTFTHEVENSRKTLFIISLSIRITLHYAPCLSLRVLSAPVFHLFFLLFLLSSVPNSLYFSTHSHSAIYLPSTTSTPIPSHKRVSTSFGASNLMMMVANTFRKLDDRDVDNDGVNGSNHVSQRSWLPKLFAQFMA